MSVIYYSGDIHGNPQGVVRFSRKMKLSETDIVVLLGDVGANYYRDGRDLAVKRALDSVGATVLCIHGNHEIRPARIPSYQRKSWNGGSVWYEERFPNLLFAEDGEVYLLEGLSHIAIGGAYSVDKMYRLERGYGWWPDEQPSQKVKEKVEQMLGQRDWKIDVVLSHTCPYQYEPREAFLPMIDQNLVDCSTEAWLENVEARLEYGHWFCGHWHIDKHVDKMHFLFHDFESSMQFKGSDRE